MRGTFREKGGAELEVANAEIRKCHRRKKKRVKYEWSEKGLDGGREQAFAMKKKNDRKSKGVTQQFEHTWTVSGEKRDSIVANRMNRKAVGEASLP